MNAYTNSVRDSIPALWFHGHYLAAATYAIIAVDDEPKFVAFMVDMAIGDLMSERFDCVREQATEAISWLMLNAKVAEAQADAKEAEACRHVS